MQQGTRGIRHRTEQRPNLSEAALVEQFKQDPESAYHELLERYSPVLLRMIRRFMSDPDEVMEVYTSICERFKSRDYQALRRFRMNGELTPWLSVVVANACRDRFRKLRATSVPKSVLTKLNERQRLVFKYYYQQNLPHDEITQTIEGKDGISCTALDIACDIEKINDLLTTKKRWQLLSVMNINRAPLSIDELRETGFHPVSSESPDALEQKRREITLEGQLKQAVAELQPEDQLLVLLRYEQGMRATQIACVMNYENPKYVYTRLRTVVNQLRRSMYADA
jgi:DNA-directed RNA polymerase specialized sigma24 family protein